MSSWAIRVQGLGKKYYIPITGHIIQGSDGASLREVLTDRARSLLRPNGNRNERRQELWALRDVSFEVKQGEIVGVIGRNGAGKTTLLKILSRITDPTAGHARIRGRVASLLEVGTGFHPELTGRENIFLNGAILGMRRAEIQRKLHQIIAFAEIEKFVDTPVKRYSSGMYVRLAFAVGAHLDPDILVIDEVLAVGDAEFQKRCLGKMNEVSAGQGRTVLLVSHQMNVVERVCRRAILIENGSVRLDSADVRSVIQAYVSSGPSGIGSLPAEWRNSGDQFGNRWFRPQRVFFGDCDGDAVRMPVPVDADIWLYVEADIETLDPALAVGYAIYAESGELLYRSYHTDTKEPDWPRLRLGRTTLRSRIPPALLNEGTYRVEIIAALYSREWLFQPGRADISVFLALHGGLGHSPLRGPIRAGLLAPTIPWETWPGTPIPS